MFDAHAVGFFYRHATPRLLGDASIPHEAKVHVHLLVRGNLHGGFHEKDLQLHQRPRDPSFNRLVMGTLNLVARVIPVICHAKPIISSRNLREGRGRGGGDLRGDKRAQIEVGDAELEGDQSVRDQLRGRLAYRRFLLQLYPTRVLGREFLR